VRFKSPVTEALMGRLTYQACTNESCLPAITKEFDVPAPPQAQAKGSSPFAS
jgi:hypothetical protein